MAETIRGKKYTGEWHDSPLKVSKRRGRTTIEVEVAKAQPVTIFLTEEEEIELIAKTAAIMAQRLPPQLPKPKPALVAIPLPRRRLV
jgi:hypothetical protein